MLILSFLTGDTLPGYLSVLTDHQIKILLSSLRSTYEVAMEFDSRPGLKFLLQKVIKAGCKANMCSVQREIQHFKRLQLLKKIRAASGTHN